MIFVSSKCLTFAGVALFCAGSAFGQVVVAPSNLTSVEGSNTDFRLLDTQAHTVQLLLEQSVLGLSAGSSITGLSFRLTTGTTGTSPDTASTFSNYEIRVGPAATTAETMSTTFANNFSSSTLVRSGALTIPANAFTGGTGPNQFPSALITFDTPFVYNGGDLVFEFRHEAGSSAVQDLDGTITGGQGWGSNFKQINADGFSATSGGLGPAVVMQLSYTAVPEPSAYALFGGLSLAAFAGVRKIRSSRMEKPL